MIRPLSATFCAVLMFIPVGTLSCADDRTQATRADRISAISQTVSDEIPLVIAHRGASGYLPEHTTESAAFAHALGADYIEQDVVLSKDGIAVVLHDITLNATTNVADVFPDRAVDGQFFVYDFTIDELRQLQISERHAKKDGRRFPPGTGRFRIATLEEHIQLIHGLNNSRNRKAGLYVEIKKPSAHRKRGLDPSREVLRILKQFGYDSADDRVFIQCFEGDEVVRLRTELNCRLPLIHLASKPFSEQEIAKIAKVADGIGVSLSTVITQSGDDEPQVTELVQMAHEHAMMVHAWTLRDDQLPGYVDSTEELLDLLVKQARVDGVFTDYPDTVLSWRKKVQTAGGIRGPFHLLNSGAAE